MLIMLMETVFLFLGLATTSVILSKTSARDSPG